MSTTLMITDAYYANEHCGNEHCVGGTGEHGHGHGAALWCSTLMRSHDEYPDAEYR